MQNRVSQKQSVGIDWGGCALVLPAWPAGPGKAARNLKLNCSPAIKTTLFPLNSRGQSQTHFGAQFWCGLTVGTIVTFMGLDSAILDLLWSVIWVLFAFPGLHTSS